MGIADRNPPPVACSDVRVVQSDVIRLNLKAERPELELEILRLEIEVSKSLQASKPHASTVAARCTPATRCPVLLLS